MRDIYSKNEAFSSKLNQNNRRGHAMRCSETQESFARLAV